MSKQKRRKLWIQPSLQSKFIIKVILVALFACALFSYLIYEWSRGSTTLAIEHTKVLIKPTAEFIFPALIGNLLLVFGVLSVGAVVVMLRFSHTIVGPVYRMIKELEKIKRGQYPANFKIRDHDQLQELAQNLKEYEDILWARHQDLAQQWKQARQLLTDHVPPGPDGEKVKRIVDAVNGHLKFFKCQ